MLFPSARKTCVSLLVLVTCLLVIANSPAATVQEAVAEQPTTLDVVGDADRGAGTPTSTSVAIVVDQSSAARYKTEDLRKAVSEFMQAFTSEDEVCLYTANDKAAVGQEFTADSALIAQALKRLKPKGKLALYDAVAAAVGHLRSDAANEKAAVVVFTAGEDNASQTSLEDLEAKLKANPPVALYAVAVRGGSLQWQSALQQVAVASGGRALIPNKGGQLKEAAALAAQGVFGRSVTQVAKSKQAERKPLAPYQSIVVRNVPVIESRNTAAAQGGENVLLHHLLVARLKKSKLFSEVVDAGNTETQAAIASASEPGRKLELLATLVEVEKGSRLSWKFLASGGTKMKVQVVLRDAATQKPVLSLVQEGSAASGLLSGGEEQVQSKAVLHAVNGIIDQLRKVR